MQETTPSTGGEPVSVEISAVRTLNVGDHDPPSAEELLAGREPLESLVTELIRGYWYAANESFEPRELAGLILGRMEVWGLFDFLMPHASLGPQNEPLSASRLRDPERAVREDEIYQRVMVPDKAFVVGLIGFADGDRGPDPGGLLRRG